MFSEMWRNTTVSRLHLRGSFKERFKTAITKLQADSNSLQKEHEKAMKRMETTLDAVTSSLRNCTQKQDNLEKGQKATESEIDSVFHSLKESLNQRQMELKNRLKKMVNTQREVLQLQLNKLQKYSDSLRKGMEEQKTLINGDAIMDTKERKKKMESIANETLKEINYSDFAAHNWCPIEFVVDQNAVSKVL